MHSCQRLADINYGDLFDVRSPSNIYLNERFLCETFKIIVDIYTNIVFLYRTCSMLGALAFQSFSDFIFRHKIYSGQCNFPRILI